VSFLKRKIKKKTKDWYKNHLGLNTDDYGCTFWWKDEENKKCATQWNPFKSDTVHFEPSKKEFMINFRVKNLVELLNILTKEGVTVVGKMEEYDYGKFAWILDNEDNKIELWEPIDSDFL